MRPKKDGFVVDQVSSAFCVATLAATPGAGISAVVRPRVGVLVAGTPEVYPFGCPDPWPGERSGCLLPWCLAGSIDAPSVL